MSTSSHDWQDYLRRLAHGVRRIALAHPQVFPLVATRPPAAPLLHRSAPYPGDHAIPARAPSRRQRARDLGSTVSRERQPPCSPAHRDSTFGEPDAAKCPETAVSTAQNVYLAGRAAPGCDLRAQLSPRSESNRRPIAYKAIALTTELRGRAARITARERVYLPRLGESVPGGLPPERLGLSR